MRRSAESCEVAIRAAKFMNLRRSRIWALMVVTATASILFTTVSLIRRSRSFQLRAEGYELQEMAELRLITAPESNSSQHRKRSPENSERDSEPQRHGK
jgi:hypothetical protein